MPKTTITPAESTAPAVVFTDETLHKAAGLAADAYRPVWTGPSGEESSGELVARHLEAAIALLDKDGWIRAYDYGKDWSTGTDFPDDDSMTVKAMLKSLLRLVREETGDPRRTLSTALRHVGEGGGRGDSDSAYIASVVLDLVVRAHTGSASASATPWSERLTRTHEDITALLNAGARFARTHGPGAAGGPGRAA
ncbi:hypothetical protein OG754_40325 (plasmid) [Streptomyces decoyicus]|uniref:DUF6197 family protein n=1 Tax=Streptomyces decoyicus TaxID=249567 RepID=UPI002E329BE0|nr:hypothetical protein [Streptomyces decoyicus]